MSAPLSRTKTAGGAAAPFVTKRSDSEIEEQRAQNKRESLIFAAVFFLFEILIIVLYAIWVDYFDDKAGLANADVVGLYNYFRDVNVMIFFGFGFLMTFLRRYGYGAIGYTLLISSLAAQWSILNQLFWVEIAEHDSAFDQYRDIGVFHLLNGLFCAAAVMISYGAILGKVTPLQMLVLGIWEPMFYWLNVYINDLELKAHDIGGGMYIHTFGAYFGLAVCFFLTSKDTRGHPDNTSCYSSDLFSFAGTLFLFIMWPSFNAAIAIPGSRQLQAIVNTFLSLTGAVISSFVVSRLVSEHKFNPVHIQNSTLAGGVVMGVAADLDLTPAGAIGSGFIAGVVSVLGYRYLSPILNNKFHIQDVCGVHNLHGMPGFMSGLVGIFVTLGLALEDSPEERTFRRGNNQAAFQVAALFISLGIAIFGGIFTGAMMWATKYIHKIFHEDFFNDRTFWELPSDYEHVVR